MPQLVDRSMMESTFSPEKLVTPEEGSLPAELNGAARSLLVNVGLPDERSSFFAMDGGFFEGESPNRFRRCSELSYFSEYEDMPKGWENWLILGEIHSDVVALDPVSGAVYSLPDGEYKACPLNRSLDSFLFFLYLLEIERPHYDFRVSDELPDPEGVAGTLRERMAGADPLPFEGVEPAWSEGFDWEAEDAPRLPTWECVLWDVHETVG
ncbi:SUKH-4 family immunity protein [Streptomyces endophytica]|uniref:SUKH-4 family immunity protein n=1 Tax=Streptomyces endophytica TaxID=2991496 RepID=A0ABY6PH22_9ACTN|nr:SUKH-4 family immunity protein [Streptomyces endophytica]UZJ33094.1 SUKH-4 family immunity protein [Streptomyces endophytica]